MDPLVILQVCPRGGDMHPAARLFLERSFFQCLRWRQASCRTCFQPGAGASRTRVCLLGRLLQRGFPVRPISAVATSILPHLGKQFFFSGGVEQLAAQHVLHQNQAVPQSSTCVRACLRECMCSHTQRRSFSCHVQTNVISWFSCDKRE